MDLSYSIRSQIDFKTATVNFYIQFDNNDGFLDWLLIRKGLKDNFKALSVAISKSRNSIKVTMPMGTSESQFRESANKQIQLLYDLYGINNYADKNNLYRSGNKQYDAFFNTLFGGSFNGGK